MRILIAGATGAIGGAFLKHAILRDEITSVMALTRKPLANESPKFENILISDFGEWEKSVDEATWQKIQEADAMIWAIGTYDLNEDVNTRYPLAFQEAFAKRRMALQLDKGTKFRFVLLSGAFVEQDQSRTLFFLPAQRRAKGVTEAKTAEFGKTHGDIWEALVVRPGGILFGDAFVNRLAESTFGKKLAIRSDELGAYVADLVVNGSAGGAGAIVSNLEMVEGGRRLLQKNE